MTWKKTLLFIGYTGLLWFCSAWIGSFLNEVTGGPPGNIRNHFPFFEGWRIAASLTGFALTDSWYAFILLGAWMTFFPPRRWWAWAAFLMVAVSLSLVASHNFQDGTWDYELADGGVAIPPAGPMAAYANRLCVATALLSIAVCTLASHGVSATTRRLTRRCSRPPGPGGLVLNSTFDSGPGGG